MDGYYSSLKKITGKYLLYLLVTQLELLLPPLQGIHPTLFFPLPSALPFLLLFCAVPILKAAHELLSAHIAHEGTVVDLFDGATLKIVHGHFHAFHAGGPFLVLLAGLPVRALLAEGRLFRV